MKATAHSFFLTGYIPTPKWLDVSSDVAAVLTVCLYHVCIDIITKNLKRAEASGTKLSDPMGNLSLCHTPLVLWICDLPEQHMQACILNNQLPVTLATWEQFGDKTAHPHCTCTHTLTHIAQACWEMDLTLIPLFIKTCRPLGLNGIHQPFW